MFSFGVSGPAKGNRTAPANRAPAAGLLITAEAMVAGTPEKPGAGAHKVGMQQCLAVQKWPQVPADWG